MDKALTEESKMEDHCWEWKLSGQGMNSMKLPNLGCNDQQSCLNGYTLKKKQVDDHWNLCKTYNTMHIYVYIYACMHIYMYYYFRCKVKWVAKQSLGVSSCYRNIASHTGHLK